jgi:type IV fimbrial biogenesis protein FimT
MTGIVAHMTSPAPKILRSENASRRVAGYSLFEMVITMSIVAILMAIAVPSYRYVTSSNRSTSEINALLGDLQFARAQAIKVGQTITVCPSNSPYTACTTTGSPPPWQAGWIVLDSTGAVLRIQPTFSSSDTLIMDKAVVKQIAFSREGFAMNLPSAVTFTLHSSSNAQFTRCLSLTVVGALSTQLNGQPTAETGTGSTCT